MSGPSEQRTMSRATSVYFQPSLRSEEVHDRSMSSGFGSRPSLGQDDGHTEYAHSSTSSLPTISRASTSRPGTRPTTASGRKSRATTASSILGNSESQSIVCAISEARGVTPLAGVAFINVSLGDVTLSQICDNQSYVKTIHKIQMLSPSRIVFMSTACPPNRPSTLFSLIQELVPEAQINSFDRSAWSETSGLEYLQNLAFENDVEPLKVATKGKYYAISSFGAVRLASTHGVFIRHLLTLRRP